MRRQITFAALLLSSVPLVGPTFAETTNEQLAAAGVRLGASMLKAAATTVSAPSSLSTQRSAERAAIQAVLGEYGDRRRNAQLVIEGVRAWNEFTLDVAVVGLAASGVGAVPALLLKTTGQLANEALISGIEGQVKRDMEGFLASRRDALVQAGGTGYEELRGLPPEQIQQRLRNGTNIYEELGTMFPGDEAAKRLAESLVIEGIRNTALATLDQVRADAERITGVEQRVANMARAFQRFERQTTESLERHGQAIGELQTAVGQLQTSVASLDQRMRNVERDQTIIADFVFDRMSPAAKAASLEGGLFAERFACPDGSTNCDAARLRTDLIARFEAEARIQGIAAELRAGVNTLGNVATLATNLGLNIPELDQAMNVGTVAVAAFEQFASGNYLGAAVAVTGLLRPRVDPDTQRHQILMNYLGQQFNQINAKLDQILQNQQKLLEAMGQLSRQMASYYEALDERLARMEFELRRVADIAAGQARAPWASCYALYEHVIYNEVQFGVRARGDFARVNDIWSVAQNMGVPARTCIELALTRPVTLSNTQWFGNFLSASTAAVYTPPTLPPADTARYHTRGQLEAFTTDVFAPTRRLTEQRNTAVGLTWAQVLPLLAAPPPTLTDARTRTAALVTASSTPPCELGGAVGAGRLRRLLCSSPSGPVAAASQLLSEPLVADHAVELSEWLLTAARLADTYDQASGRFLPPGELIERAAQLSGLGQQSAGRAIVADTQMMLDVVTASYTLLYGEMAARQALVALGAPILPDANQESARQAELTAIRRLLQQNSYLAANAAMVRLHEKHETIIGNSPASPLAYRAALEFARTASGVDRFLMLRGLFGDLAFEYDADRQFPVLVLAAGATPAERVLVPLPSAEAFARGHLSYPPRMIALLRQGERIAERLYDYDLLARRTAAERPLIAGLIVRAETASPER